MLWPDVIKSWNDWNELALWAWCNYEEIGITGCAAAADPKVIEAIQGAGSPMAYLDSPEFEAYVGLDIQRMEEVVKKMGQQN